MEMDYYCLLHRWFGNYSNWFLYNGTHYIYMIIITESRGWENRGRFSIFRYACSTFLSRPSWHGYQCFYSNTAKIHLFSCFAKYFLLKTDHREPSPIFPSPIFQADSNSSLQTNSKGNSSTYSLIVKIECNQ